MAIKIKSNVMLMLEIASKCGAISRELCEEMGIKYKRLKQMEEANYINKEEFFVRENNQIKTRYLYTLDSNGKEIVENEGICTHVAPLSGYTHTKKSEKIYLELRKTNDANTILNEQEQRYSYYREEIEELDRNKIDYSIADFCVLNESGVEFVEVVTENYRKLDFIKKENYCRAFGKEPQYR